MLADMAMQVEAARQPRHYAAAAGERGDERTTFLGSAASVWPPTRRMKVTVDVVLISAATATSKDYSRTFHARRAKITQIHEGTNQIQRLVMARNLLK